MVKLFLNYRKDNDYRFKDVKFLAMADMGFQKCRISLLNVLLNGNYGPSNDQ
jgi:hypothetical protein